MNSGDLSSAARLTSSRELQLGAVFAAGRARELAAEGEEFLADYFHELAVITAEVREERRAMARQMDSAVAESLGIPIVRVEGPPEINRAVSIPETAR